jgi:uncharacterized protein (TIGR03382 family)
MRRRSFLTGFLLAFGSAIAAVLFRRRHARAKERAQLYFADGTTVSFAEGSPGAEPLLRHARELLGAAR